MCVCLLTLSCVPSVVVCNPMCSFSSPPSVFVLSSLCPPLLGFAGTAGQEESCAFRKEGRQPAGGNAQEDVQVGGAYEWMDVSIPSLAPFRQLRSLEWLMHQQQHRWQQQRPSTCVMHREQAGMCHPIMSAGHVSVPLLCRCSLAMCPL